MIRVLVGRGFRWRTEKALPRSERSTTAAASLLTPQSRRDARLCLPRLLRFVFRFRLPLRFHSLPIYFYPERFKMSAKGGSGVLTDYEEAILFDLDDPDFEAGSPPSTVSLVTRKTQVMSIVGSRVGSCRSSWSDEQQSGEPVLSIEELRLQLNSCFTCGVSWQDEHVSLDCAECGGYSLERPCLVCNGHCGAAWSRDVTISHASGKARWKGCCRLADTEQRLLSPPSMRLENISATS